MDVKNFKVDKRGETVRIGSLLDFSTVDWVGHRTFMVFCGGCNFRCPYCHNGPLLSPDSGQDVGLEVVTDRVSANIGFLDAMGFTGGEPTLQPQPVTGLCRWARTMSLETFLNTNGSNPRLVRELVEANLLDFVAMDVKAPFTEDDYGRVAGLQGNVARIIENIKETMDLCYTARVPMELRTTVVPTLIDDEASIRAIAGVVKGRGTYVLQEFSSVENVLDERLKGVASPDRERLIHLAEVALDVGVEEVYVRTRRAGTERVFS